MKNHNGTWLPNGDTFFETKGDYEASDYQLLKKYVNGGHTAIDIGAHVGYWTRRLVNDYVHVIAFEAEPEHVECLKLNVNNNANVTIHPVALSDHDGTVCFSKNTANSGMSHVDPNGTAIACNQLDTWGYNHVNLIKIDVEGHELQVLRGAEKTINHSKPVLFIEILNSTPLATRTAILDLLHSWNYYMADSIAENYIFVRNKDE